MEAFDDHLYYAMVRQLLGQTDLLFEHMDKLYGIYVQRVKDLEITVAT